MKSLLSILILISFLTSCKQEKVTPKRSVAMASGCPEAAWANESLPLTFSVGSDLQNFLTTHYENDPNLLGEMADVWNKEFNGSETLIKTTINTINDPKHSVIENYRFDRHNNLDVLGIYKSDTWFGVKDSGILAVAQYYLDNNTGHLVHADVIFNFHDFAENFKQNPVGKFHYDIGFIALHELGHALGTCHYSKTTSVMNPSYMAGIRKLFGIDQTRIKEKYPNVVSFQALKIAQGSPELFGIRKRSTKASASNETRIVSELNVNGECNHYADGKLISTHKVELNRNHK